MDPGPEVRRDASARRLANYVAFALFLLTLGRIAWLGEVGAELSLFDMGITPALATWALWGIPRGRKDGWVAAGFLSVFVGVFGILAAWGSYLAGSPRFVGYVVIASTNLACFLLLYAVPSVRHLFEPPPGAR